MRYTFNVRLEVVSRKNEKEFLFYLTVLILLKIGSEVTMAKCWYLLNSSGGCLSVYIMLFFSILCYIHWDILKLKFLTWPCHWQLYDWRRYMRYFSSFQNKIKLYCHRVVTRLSHNWECWLVWLTSEVRKAIPKSKSKLPVWASKWVDLFWVLDGTCNASGATTLVWFQWA